VIEVTPQKAQLGHGSGRWCIGCGFDWWFSGFRVALAGGCVPFAADRIGGDGSPGDGEALVPSSSLVSLCTGRVRSNRLSDFENSGDQCALIMH
jgi:hypothetical protein